MKRGLVFLAVGVALMGALGGAVAYAQEISIVNVPFKFTVHDKALDAGKYEISVTDQAVISVTPQKGAAMFAPTITRLAVHQPMKDATFVFDKVGDQYVLSEVWIPGADGYLITDTKQAHTHHIVKGAKKTA